MNVDGYIDGRDGDGQTHDPDNRAGHGHGAGDRRVRMVLGRGHWCARETTRRRGRRQIGRRVVMMMDRGASCRRVSGDFSYGRRRREDRPLAYGADGGENSLQ